MHRTCAQPHSEPALSTRRRRASAPRPRPLQCRHLRRHAAPLTPPRSGGRLGGTRSCGRARRGPELSRARQRAALRRRAARRLALRRRARARSLAARAASCDGAGPARGAPRRPYCMTMEARRFQAKSRSVRSCPGMRSSPRPWASMGTETPMSVRRRRMASARRRDSSRL